MFSEEQITDILAALPDPAFILTRSGCYAAIFGGSDLRYYHDGSGLIGKSLHDVLHAEKAMWFAKEIEKALSSHKLHIVEYELAGSDVKGLEDGPSNVIWFEGRVQALNFQVLGEDAVLWVASNITERHELETQLRSLSERDPLTNLFNRRKLLAMLEDQYELFNRYTIPTAVFIFDINDFKKINDQYGHLMGDQALQAIAQSCTTELRAPDMAARFGGDEFVIVMPHTDQNQALSIIERLSASIEKTTAAIGFANGIKISGGLSEILSGDTSVEAVMRRADEKLYQAKDAGRTRISELTPLEKT